MELQSLEVMMREGVGKSAAHKVRQNSRVPGVLYGGGKGPVSVTINQRDFEHLLHGHGGRHAVLQLNVRDHAEMDSPALLKNVQYHPVRGGAIHADFLRIRLDERIVTFVPVELTGKSPGVVEGGILDQQIRELEVECLALEVPEKIQLDVSQLGMASTLFVSNVAAPANVRIVTPVDRPVVTVRVPRAVEEAVPAAAEAVEGVEAAEGEEAAEEKKGGEEEKETKKG